MHKGREVLIYLAIKYDGDYQKVIDAARKGESPTYAEIKAAMESIKSNVITILDEEYPEYLRKVPFAPPVLFYYGDISLISKQNFEKNVAVIGTRHPTQYGIEATEKIVEKLVDSYNIVSGLAKGIDGLAHLSCLINRGKTIAVLGSGIDNVYPVENTKLYHDIIRNGGLVVSEYPNMSEPSAGHFPIRDRIIAQLSRAVVVTEAYGRTGTSITVGFANEYNRDVMAIPYPYDKDDSFCNQLLYEGAIFVRNGNDVLSHLNKF